MGFGVFLISFALFILYANEHRSDHREKVLKQGEKAAIQMVIHPKSKGWRKKAKEMGTQYFRNKKPKGFRIPIIGPIIGLIWWPFKVVLTGFDPAIDGSNAPGSSGGDSYVRMLASEEEIAKSIGEKAIQSGFDCVIRAIASSPGGKERSHEILNGIFVAFNAFKGKGMNRLQNMRILPIDRINTPVIVHNFKYRLLNFVERKSVLVPEELASIFHFPDARYNKIPTIKWLDYKVLPPPINLPKEGILIMGNEANGVSEEIKKLITNKISIPRFGETQETESLNVATATAILLSEFKRSFQ